MARVAVQAGLGLAPNQQLVVTAPIQALPLVRRVTEQAYRAGASLVTTIFNDEEMILTRFRHAPEESFDHAADWLFDGIAAALKGGAARLSVGGENPALLVGQDANRIARINRASSRAYRPVLQLTADFTTNWTVIPYATRAWARMVFPSDPEELALTKLWEVIFASMRVDQDDPLGAWQAHTRHLLDRTRALNEKQYSALHFRGPGTDLRIGLAEGHVWNGGVATARNGVVCSANIPSEEVFTAPHKEQVDGIVASTKPAAYRGTLISDVVLRFSAGAVVEARARSGEAVLRRIIDTDEGARRLGEVALVPQSSPIARSGLLFYNTLVDENAASHVALGAAFRRCIRDGDTISDPELAARGSNQSLIHVDWMIGSTEVDVDGIGPHGTCEPVMRHGEWVK